VGVLRPASLDVGGVRVVRETSERTAANLLGDPLNKVGDVKRDFRDYSVQVPQEDG